MQCVIMHAMTDQQKYKRCMVFAGGGFRFACYLGMHAASEDQGQAPDLLLATCGGALACATICAFPDRAARKAWVASAEMFGFLRGITPGPGAGLVHALIGLAVRAAGGRCRVVPDLFEDYMFGLPGPLPLPAQAHPAAPDWAMIGARIEFSPQDVGRLAERAPLFTECVFGNGRVAALVHATASPMYGQAWGSTVMGSEIDAAICMPMNVAARVSMADLVYFRCHHSDGRNYTGGVIDLVPIEIAHRLAHSVTMEAKAPFPQLTAAPALRSVLGIDANARLRHVHRQSADYWVDTSDASRVLRAHSVRKNIYWRAGQYGLRWPSRLAEYQAQIEAQWQYGYARACEAYTRGRRSGLPHLRFQNHLNVGAV
jgi:hypothetical protein